MSRAKMRKDEHELRVLLPRVRFMVEMSKAPSLEEAQCQTVEEGMTVTETQIRGRGYAVWTSPTASLEADVRARAVSALEGLFASDAMRTVPPVSGRIYGPRGDSFGWIQSMGAAVDTLEIR